MKCANVMRIVKRSRRKLLHVQSQWFSGKIRACHARAPCSIHGCDICFCLSGGQWPSMAILLDVVLRVITRLFTLRRALISSPTCKVISHGQPINGLAIERHNRFQTLSRTRKRHESLFASLWILVMFSGTLCASP